MRDFLAGFSRARDEIINVLGKNRGLVLRQCQCVSLDSVSRIAFVGFVAGMFWKLNKIMQISDEIENQRKIKFVGWCKVARTFRWECQFQVGSGFPRSWMSENYFSLIFFIRNCQIFFTSALWCVFLSWYHVLLDAGLEKWFFVNFSWIFGNFSKFWPQLFFIEWNKFVILIILSLLNF